MRTHRRTRALAIAAAVLAVPGIALAAAPAQAATQGDIALAAATGYHGRVVSDTGLHVRTMRTTASRVAGTLATGTVVTIGCKARGEPIDGNRLWYRLGARRWVTARYVANIGPAPAVCDGAEATGKVIARPALTMRDRPTTASPRRGSLGYGTVVEIICKVNGQSVGGNPRWYQLFNGNWVAARYVANIGFAPDSCR